MTATFVAPNAGEQLLIKIGDGGTPTEVFAHPALINSDRSYKGSTSEVATEIPRTDNPSAPAKTVRGITATDSQITGAGILNVGDDLVYENWRLSGAPKNVKVYNNITGGLTVTGPYVLTDFEISGSRGGKVMCQLTLKQADLPTTAAAT